MAYDDIDFGSIIGDRANLYETADGKRFMATDAESSEAFDSLGLTRQKRVVFKGGDGYNHVVPVDEGFTPDDAWMREHDAKSIVKTELPDNYVNRVNTYALPDGNLTKWKQGNRLEVQQISLNLFIMQQEIFMVCGSMMGRF